MSFPRFARRRLAAARLLLIALLLGGAPLVARPAAAQQRPLTFTDLMQIRRIQDVALSDDGGWVALAAVPDRGDPEGLVYATGGGVRYSVPLGTDPAVGADGRHVAFRLVPSLEAVEAAEDDPPKAGMVLLATATGDTVHVARVDRFAFSADGRFLAYHHFEAPPDTSTAGAAAPDDEAEAAASEPGDDRTQGTRLVVRDLTTGSETSVEAVHAFAFDEAGRYLAVAVAHADSTEDALYLHDLATGRRSTLHRAPHVVYHGLAWSDEGGRLAFLAAEEDADGEPGEASLWQWDGRQTRPIQTSEAAPAGWMIPAEHNPLTWTEGGERLFFGYRPEDDAEEDAEEDAETDTTAAFDPYDLDALLDDRTVDVWHWDDPLINTNQKEQWDTEQRRTYRAVYHADRDRVVPLGGPVLDLTGTPQNAERALGSSDEPYLKMRTWEGFFSDLYTIDLATGAPTRVAEKLAGGGRSLSPEGRYVVYYDQADYHLYDARAGTTRNLTAGLGVPFANEDHDYPSDPPGYGVAGWMADDAAVLLYDKFDIWHVPTGGGAPTRLTGGEGRAAQRQFRIVDLEEDREAFAPGETVLVSGYHTLRKNDGIYQIRLDPARPGLARLYEEPRQLRILDKADDADVVVFTREDYDEFPDLWITNTAFAEPRKLTDVNPHLDDFAWGTSELVEWHNLDGTPMQGVLIKPAGYVEGERYPVLVYFYRFFSQRLHEFTDPRVNHRPYLPLYSSDGYAVFLPDIRFEVGQPGFSATKSLVPGVQKLIDMGVADPERIGLHGHSWSGYQAAFVVTQTDIFAAASAGAPVSNMTSAYGGIRWGSGLARQFQYETGQSRMGGSLWEVRDRYIDNSPLFFADRINTPLLIIHGDEDGAVPWYQGIELYLALRRFEKPVWFLQYRGEDHHPQAYANKLDWAMKMKQYFDHFLKGEPAPAWIEEGIPYAGD